MFQFWTTCIGLSVSAVHSKMHRAMSASVLTTPFGFPTNTWMCSLDQSVQPFSPECESQQQRISTAERAILRHQ